MDVTAWSNGSGHFGLYIGKRNRDEHFERDWSVVEIEIDSRVHFFELSEGFWRDCPEIRDSGEPVIREWLAKHGGLHWAPGSPPRMTLLPLASGRFRLSQ
ncbi:MAG TPA: hypothetical protein VMP01_04575 [Pirellulaceae bacterium]|nr:hypothetical protein [Pirellulaceae bacterium]